MAPRRVPLTIIIGGAVTAGGGLAAAVTGGIQMRRVKRVNRIQAQRYDERYAAHQAAVVQTNECLQT
jgi:hypothetical protein